MNGTHWRTGNDSADDNELAGMAAAIENNDLSMTIQAATADADINEVLRRFGVTDGSLPPAAINWQSIDLTAAPASLSDALHQIHGAQDMFYRLPAAVKARFHNDPDELLLWAQDPANLDEAVQLGFLKQEGDAAAPPSNPPPTQ